MLSIKASRSLFKRCSSALLGLLLMTAWSSYACASDQAYQPHYAPCPAGQVPSEGGCFDKPKLLSGHFPEYPPVARRNKQTGSVRVNVVVGKDGKVISATSIYCSKPGLGFETSAIYAVKKWKLAPALLSGEPISFQVDIIFDFYLGQREP